MHRDARFAIHELAQRFALNFKGLAYRTVWVEYPDIGKVIRPCRAQTRLIQCPATVAQKIGAKPAPTIVGISMPTVPMIYDPSTDTAMSDSSEIVKYLDKQYPSETAIIPAGTDALQAM